MLLRPLFLLFLLTFSSLSALLTGNPAQPGLLTSSIVRSSPSSWSFRVGYFDDWIYSSSLRDEFKLEGSLHPQTHIELSTYSALLTFNFIDRIDLYGLVGSSRLQIEEEIFTKRALSWGYGAKCVLIKAGNFFLGIDGKYFETNQKPRYFTVEGLPYNIACNYRLKYTEGQGAIGISYLASLFAPYINATYIFTRIEPTPPVLLVRLPDMNALVDVESKSIICRKKWGMALGLTLADSQRASLSFEWRAFNQNAIDVNAEIRF